MIIIGCIRQVQKMALDINLPGRIFGRVMVTHISAAYTKLLHSIVDDTEPEVGVLDNVYFRYILLFRHYVEITYCTVL